ncbi:MAG: biopolymer transporter ExbD [Pseudomonadota bacterium]
MADRSRLVQKAEDINLVPIMNMVSLLIPFLLMAASFVNLAVIDSALPAIGQPQQVEQDPDEKPPLMLSLMITDRGITVAGADAVLHPEGAPELAEGEERPPTVPCKSDPCASPNDYDFDELTRLLALIKDEYPDDENVILVPESRILYETIVLVMDASREDVTAKKDDGSSRTLFPFVVIAGGAE